MFKLFARSAFVGVCAFYGGATFGQAPFERDQFQTAEGPLEITFIGHGTLMFSWNDRVIYIDPVGHYADYSKLPKADLILITHEHGDHLDPKAIEQTLKPTTFFVGNPNSASKLGKGKAIKNGETIEVRCI